MDQVDNIIFQNLISLGWEKEEDVNSLKDLEVSEVAKLLIKCLYAINPDCDLPQSLPHNMSHRFRVSANIAESIKELGYCGDLGYQSILYSNEVDLRKIFTYLIEKLPKDAPTLIKEPLGKTYLIEKEACKKINEALQRPWIPPHCAAISRKYKARSNNGEDLPLIQYGISHTHSFVSDWFLNYKINSGFNKGDFVKPDESENISECLKGSPQTILATFLNCHSEQLGKKLSDFESNEFKISDAGKENMPEFEKKRFDNVKRCDLVDLFENSCPGKKNMQSVTRVDISKIDKVSLSYQSDASSNIDKQTDVEDLLKAREEDRQKQIRTLTIHISQAQDEVVDLIKTCKEKEAHILVLQETLKEKEEMLSTDERNLTLLRKTSSLLADPEGNLQKLKEALQAGKERESKLLKQWLEFKEPLEEELQAAKLQLEKKMSKQNKIENEIIELMKNNQTLLDEAKMKEVLLTQLKDQKIKLNKGTNRAVYTKQILDISAKVQKQKQEIKKILSETRIIQKEINSLTGKLQRTFAVVEDASFKAASSNERARQIYRSVVTIHEEFGSLVDITREIGIIQRETADLQQQLNSEKSKNIEDNLKKLQEDFNKLKLENLTLKQSLKS